MKTSLQAALVAASAVLLAACASSGGLAKAPAPTHSPGTSVVDSEYMAMVEHVASRRGVKVRWFNPPTKSATAVADTRTGTQ